MAPLIILSGAYATDELVAEYGALPPAFLPVGNKRLYEHQIEDAGGCPVMLTMPAGYDIPPADAARLKSLGVRTLFTDTGLSLASALEAALTALGGEGPVRLLLGDTQVKEAAALPFDSVAIAHTVGHYHWTYLHDTHHGPRFEEGKGSALAGQPVVVGAFAFSCRATLSAALADARSMAEILNGYHARTPLSLTPVSTWHDFGHLVLFYQSRRHMLVSRVFNRVVADGETVAKTSQDAEKLAAEKAWYRALKGRLRLHAPRLVEAPEVEAMGGYATEYLNHPSLSDLFVFGNLARQTRQRLLDDTLTLLNRLQRAPIEGDVLKDRAAFSALFHEKIFATKSRERITHFMKAQPAAGLPQSLNGRPLPSIATMVASLSAGVTAGQAADISIWHGDFCFANLFYDFRAGRVMAIDPRGLIAPGLPSLYGDKRYDLAKLTHSVVGYYDRIVCGRVRVQKNGTDWTLHLYRSPEDHAFEAYFWEKIRASHPYSRQDLLALAALLFFSMLSLHADDTARQDALLANACRLYLNWQAEAEGVPA